MECARALRNSKNGLGEFDSSKLAAINQLMRASALCATAEQAQNVLREAIVVSQEMDQNTFEKRQIASLLSESLATQTHAEVDAACAMNRALDVTELDPRCAGAWLRAARWSAKLSNPCTGEYARRAIESDDSMRFDVLLKFRPADRHEAEELAASWPPWPGK